MRKCLPALMVVRGAGLPDKRAHRGPHPEDVRLFAAEALPALRQAVADLAWLLGRGYAEKSALKLVGDRFALTERQRIAVMRCTCPDAALADRRARRLEPGSLAGECLRIDGYNVLTTIEAALAGGVIIAGRDGCFRDMASMHGTFRTVAETRPALELLVDALAGLGLRDCACSLEAPVSNSGRLAGLIREVLQARGLGWEVGIVASPDAILALTDDPVATADSVILDRCRRWFNLSRHIVIHSVPSAWVIDLA